MTWEWKSRRRSELPRNWAGLRELVKARDRGRCVLCGEPGTDVDHVGDRHDHRLENLRLLCSTCHKRVTGLQAARARRGNAEARAAQAARARLRAHPGWTGRRD